MQWLLWSPITSLQPFATVNNPKKKIAEWCQLQEAILQKFVNFFRSSNNNVWMTIKAGNDQTVNVVQTANKNCPLHLTSI